MEEQWKPIKSYEGIYEISNLGRVRSLTRVVNRYNRWPMTVKGKILTPFPNTGGYLRIRLCKQGKEHDYSIHRLVALAFLPNPKGLEFINHKDENKSNNKATNLEWCNRFYNNNYGTRTYRASVTNTNGKQSKVILQYTLSGKLVKIWPSISETGRHGYSQPHITSCCRQKYGRKTHKGFIWKYAETEQ